MKVPCGGAVYDNLSGSLGQRDRVCHHPLPVIQVPDRNLLALDDIGAAHQAGVDPDAADVVHIGARHHRMVDLGLRDNPQLHQLLLYPRLMLTILATG